RQAARRRPPRRVPEAGGVAEPHPLARRAVAGLGVGARGGGGMSDKKIIAVLGSTGAQGGGLVRAILADPEGEFAARALTRDPAKEQAQALAAAGAEVVQADLDDEASLCRAFEAAYGVYAVTNFWEHF